MGRNYFGWNDAADDVPAQLAEKFVQRYADTAAASWGDDTDYARWYARMLKATEPDGLIYAVADFPVPDDQLCTLNVAGHIVIPLPPGGGRVQ